MVVCDCEKDWSGHLVKSYALCICNNKNIKHLYGQTCPELYYCELCKKEKINAIFALFGLTGKGKIIEIAYPYHN